MKKLKVGQLRQDCKGMYVITKLGTCATGDFADIIYSDGSTSVNINDDLYYMEKDEIIAEYNGWLNALNSEEFKNDVCNF